MSPLEAGGTYTLKLMLDIMMDVEDSALCLLVQRLQTLQMKDIKGENESTVVSYLKGTLLLLQNCTELTTDTLGLLNDAMTSETDRTSAIT